jgi:TonB-dependent starch-binding outer membrane protein SusC
MSILRFGHRKNLTYLHEDALTARSETNQQSSLEILNIDCYMKEKLKLLMACVCHKPAAIHFLFIAFIQLALVSSLFAQTATVKGTVNDAQGKGLPGVSVKVKGTNTGTVTDENGAYSINVTSPGSAVLQYSYVGYATREERVGGRELVSISLEQGTGSLDEVVVVGYGQTVKKRDLTGAISSVSNKQIQERQPINLFDALQGQAAGVLIMNDNGEPGAEGSIQIRGANTFTADGNSPLYIVDGVLTDNASAINPNDIERVEILKDAASASIYGARSAAGVILITTKKGKEGKPRIDAQYSRVYGWLAHKIQAANANDLRKYRRLQNPTSSTAGTFTDSLNPSFNTDNDLQELLLGNTGKRDDIKLGVSGGSKGLFYYGSLNYINDEGIALNTWNKSIQSRINTELQVSKKFKYTNNLSFYWSYGNFTSINNSLRPVFDRPSYARIYLPDGSLTSYLASKRNPVTNALMEDNTRETIKAQMNHQIDYQLLKSLKFTTSFNAQITSFEGFYFAPRYLDDGGDENFGRNDMNRGFNWMVQSFLNYNKKFGDHNLTAMVGVQKDRVKNDYTHLDGKNFVIETAHYVKGAFMNNLTNQYASASAVSTASAFSRINYSFRDKYILAGSYRRDASSRFHPDYRIGNFFSASAAWRFSDEKFMDWTQGILNDGKLRISWGQLGNDRVGNYDYLTLINQAAYSYNGVASASFGSNMANQKLGWEATVQTNVGLDLSFFKSRVTLAADYYVKTTNRLLYNRPFFENTGFDRAKVNIGSIETRGLEFQLNTVPVAQKNFTWTLNGNIAFERGRVLELADHQPFITGKWLIEEGGRIGNFYGWKDLGIYQYDVSNAYDKDGNKLTPVDIVLSADRKTVLSFGGYTLNGKTYSDSVYRKTGNGIVLQGGDREWVDVNNDGVIDDADRMILGNAQPDFYLGIINTVSYKQFSLNFIVNATIGGQVYNSFKYNLTNNSSSNGPALPEAIYGAWEFQGDVATYPYFPRKNDRGSLRPGGNSYFIEDASFIRLSSARLTYRLKPSVAKKAFMNNATLYVYGTNILTFTNYTGYDPEFSSNNALEPGDDNGRYPKRRELGLGINLSF